MPIGAQLGCSEEQFDKMCTYIDEFVLNNPNRPYYAFEEKDLKKAAGEPMVFFSTALIERLEKAYGAAEPKWGKVKWEQEKTSAEDGYGTRWHHTPAQLLLEPKR